MIRAFKILGLVVFILFISCNTKKEDKKPAQNKLSREVIESKHSKIFYSKDEIILPSNDKIFFSGGNEIILFRPTEADFGILLEETQDQDLLDLDGNFEALTNQIVINFSSSRDLKISICEQLVIAIPQISDTLYFDTSKEKYGFIFSKEGEKPIFKSAKTEDIVQQIKNEYDL